MLSDITRSGVEAAIKEYDEIGQAAFLERYGFGKSRSYYLVANGQRYDSKAICGAAHGYDLPEQGPLRPQDFSGGDARVRPILERLGFEMHKRQPSKTSWSPEERILALQLYFRIGVVSASHPEVIALSRELNQLALHPDAGTREDFRNPNGVNLKLANFAALDPSNPGRGMQAFSAGDEETWDEYSGDLDLLDEAAAAIRVGLPEPEQPRPVSSGRDHTSSPVLRRPIEERRVDSYEVRPQLDARQAERREAELVERFAAWLGENGATVCSHHYNVVNPPLRTDLIDETEKRFWEAKSDVRRSSIRMALGQLLDYRRCEAMPSEWNLGVLLPNAPSDDLEGLILSIGATVAWPTANGFQISGHARPVLGRRPDTLFAL